MSRLDTHWSEQGMEITRKEGTVIATKAGPADRQARKPGDSQETTAGGERRSREGWWSVRCQQDGKQCTRSGRGATGDSSAASHKLLLCFWPEEEPIREQPCCNAAVLPLRDKGKLVSTDSSFSSLYAELLPLDGSFEQRHCLLKVNVKKKKDYLWREHKMVEKQVDVEYISSCASCRLNPHDQLGRVCVYGIYKRSSRAPTRENTLVLIALNTGGKNTQEQDQIRI